MRTFLFALALAGMAICVQAQACLDAPARAKLMDEVRGGSLDAAHAIEEDNLCRLRADASEWQLLDEQVHFDLLRFSFQACERNWRRRQPWRRLFRQDPCWSALARGLRVSGNQLRSQR